MGDLDFWRLWSTYIFNNGLQNAYQSTTDYPPGYQYVLYIYTLLQSDQNGVSTNIYYLKFFTLLFHVLNSYLLFWLFKKQPHEAFYASLVYLFNFSILYNGIVWGQVDDIFTCFVFIAFIASYQARILPALLSFLLAINFKLQAIIFAPPLFLLLLPVLRSRISPANLLKWVLIPLMMQVALILPFALNGDTHRILEVILHSGNRYPIVSASAYNFWCLMMEVNPYLVDDSLPFIASMSYKTAGLLLFFFFSFAALWPSLIAALKVPAGTPQPHPFNLRKGLITMGLIPLVFFFFNTEMHERYSHPALIFLFCYGFRSKRYLPFVLASGAYFLNLEDVLHWLSLKNYNTFIFSRDFIATLYLLAILHLFYDLYFIKRENNVPHEDRIHPPAHTIHPTQPAI